MTASPIVLTLMMLVERLTDARRLLTDKSASQIRFLYCEPNSKILHFGQWYHRYHWLVPLVPLVPLLVPVVPCCRGNDDFHINKFCHRVILSRQRVAARGSARQREAARGRAKGTRTISLLLHVLGTTNLDEKSAGTIRTIRSMLLRYRINSKYTARRRTKWREHCRCLTDCLWSRIVLAR
jgi:hypothetical protein